MERNFDMKKIALALAATVALSSAAQAGEWEYRRYHEHNHYYNRGGNGDAGVALFGGLVGGMILGGMMANQQPQYYVEQPMYQRYCHTVFEGRIWNGYTWVDQYSRICN